MADKPLILLDVDGVLNAFTKPGPHWQEHRAAAGSGSFRVILNPDHGPMLLTLAAETGAELVWATTWEHDANLSIGPLIGLPELPVIEVSAGTEVPGVLWKTPAVAEYVQGRPFVWFDDDLNRADRGYLKRHEGVGDFLIVDVGPRKGLTGRHLEMAADWLSNLAAIPPA